MLISVEVSNMFSFFSIILVILYLVGVNYLVRILRMNLDVDNNDDDGDGIACSPRLLCGPLLD